MSQKWTQIKPSTNGLYWYFDGEFLTMIRVSMPSDPDDDAEAYICRMGTELYDTEFPKDGYWMGPITEPEKPC